MNLSIRRMTLADVSPCHAQLTLFDRHLYDEADFDALPGLWRALLLGGQMQAYVLEDLDLCGPQRLVAFGTTVFLSEGLGAEALAVTGVNREISRRLQEGRSPLLTPAAVRAANSGEGLHLHAFHQAIAAPNLMAEENRAVWVKFAEMFFQHICPGWRLKEVTIEVYGDAQAQLNLNGGFRLRSGAAASPSEDAPPEARPILLGLTSVEARRLYGAAMSFVFEYTPPRLFFRPTEQDLLRAALDGLSDAQAAEALCLALPTIRKRWRTIFERASQVLPWLFCPSAPLRPGAGRRGPEKRETLLQYLRSHPEELRPILPPPCDRLAR